jgi:hypothetical protein
MIRIWLRRSCYATIERSSHQLNFDEDQLLVAAVEYVVFNAGRPEICDSRGKVGKPFLASFQDPHTPGGDGDDDVVKFMTMKTSVRPGCQTMTSDAGAGIIDLPIGFFAHGSLDVV